MQGNYRAGDGGAGEESDDMKLNGLMWWIDRWRKSTAYTEMTLEQQAGYWNLLDEATLRGGPLPNDDRILARACGDVRRWKYIKPAILKRFTLGADGWRNETLDEVIAVYANRLNKEATKRAQDRARMRRTRDSMRHSRDSASDSRTNVRATSWRHGGDK
jgi:uncharacterized protein YdaU (DUF1376 family)